MGTRYQPVGLGDALFTRTQQKVLGLLFGNPHRSYYANELVRLAGGGTGAVLRQIEKLRAVELITLDKIGNQKHYQANAQCPIYDELCSIVRKTFGLSDVLARALEPFADRIDLAFIYGSYAAETDKASSDIDLFVVGRDFSYAEAMEALGEVENRLGRKVNPVIYTARELERKLHADNAFLRRVLAKPKVFLIGSERELVS